MIFKDSKHEELYLDILSGMTNTDCFHQPVAYLLSLDNVLREHIQEIFDLKKDCIKIESLHSEWQTSTSRKTTRLIFNLWNCCCSDGETYIKDGYIVLLPSENFSVCEIFCSEYAPYYYESLKLRFLGFYDIGKY